MPDPASHPARPIGAVAWTVDSQRAHDLAGVLGGESVIFGNAGLRDKWTAPLRYLINTARTVAWFARRRPRVLIVQNPPIVLAVLGGLLTRLSGGALVLDSHPGSFGLKGRKIWAAALPLHRALARRSAAVLVTVNELADTVRAWGGRALLVHEAPPESSEEAITPPPPADAPLEVLLVCIFASDEPVDVAVAAARLVPDVSLRITGDLGRAGGLEKDAPDNVEFVGYLDKPRYRAALSGAHAIMALTTESTSVMRSGYEAVYAERPLIISDWPVNAEVFPHAVRAANTPEALAGALRRTQRELGALQAIAPRAREAQSARWAAQREALIGVCEAALRR